MSIWSILTSKIRKRKFTLDSSELCISQEDLNMDAIRQLSLGTISNKIAGIITKCNFLTFENGKKVEEEEYYSWNYEPNKIENTSIFIDKLVSKLIMDNKAIVVLKGNERYVADSFFIEEEQIGKREYKDIIINNISFTRILKEEDVLSLKLHDEDIKEKLTTVFNFYSELIKEEVTSIKQAAGEKGIFNYGTFRPAAHQDEKEIRDEVMESFKSYFENPKSIMTLYDGMRYEKTSGDFKGVPSTRETKSLIDDFYNLTAKAYSFPANLMTGDVQDTSKAIEELLTFCADTIIKQLEREINRKIYGKEKVLKKTYLKIDTKNARHVDIFDMPKSFANIVSTSALTIDEVREKFNEEPIESGWGKNRLLTKNYAVVDENINNVSIENKKKGG